jgi:hypothetical protein
MTSTTITLELDRPLLNDLQAMASDEGVTFDELVRRLCREATAKR